jgi:uncharacterized membrane protein
MKERKTLIAAIVLSLFFLAISMFSLYMESIKPGQLDPSLFEEMSTEEIISYFQEIQTSRFFPMLYFVPVIAFVGLLVGFFVYYILAERIDVKQHQLKINTRILLNLLEPGEKKAVEKILEEGGKVHQSEISYLPSLNKVKTHRILNRLEQRGIIRRERLGKINMIRLEQGILDALRNRE